MYVQAQLQAIERLQPLTPNEIFIRALLFALAGSISFGIMLGGFETLMTHRWPHFNPWIRDSCLAVSLAVGQTALFPLSKGVEVMLIRPVEYGDRLDKDAWWNSTWEHVVDGVFGIFVLGGGLLLFVSVLTVDKAGLDSLYICGALIVSFGAWSVATDVVNASIGKPIIVPKAESKTVCHWVSLVVLKIPFIFMVVVLGREFFVMTGAPDAVVRPLITFCSNASFVTLLVICVPMLHDFLKNCVRLAA